MSTAIGRSGLAAGAGDALRWMRIVKAPMIALVLSVAGGEARAFLDTGTLLTNAASATYQGGGQGTSVTYSATAKILVANPAVFLWKDVNPTYMCTTGGTVTYTICFSNGGANTAFNVTIKDRLPLNSWGLGNSGYVNWFVNTAGVAGPATSSGWTTNGGTNWTAGLSPYGTNLGGGTGFYEWTIANLGLNRSGCIVFLISIN